MAFHVPGVRAIVRVRLPASAGRLGAAPPSDPALPPVADLPPLPPVVPPVLALPALPELPPVSELPPVPAHRQWPGRRRFRPTHRRTWDPRHPSSCTLRRRRAPHPRSGPSRLVERPDASSEFSIYNARRNQRLTTSRRSGGIERAPHPVGHKFLRFLERRDDSVARSFVVPAARACTADEGIAVRWSR